MGILKNLLVLGSAKFANVIKGTVEHAQNGIYFGSCATAAATAAKVITLDDPTGFELKSGVMICVKFTNTNTAANVTFNVQGTGAKSVSYAMNTAYAGTASTIVGISGYSIYYVYDGTYWCFVNNQSNYANNSDTYTSAYCGTAAGTAAKAATCTNYALKANSYLHVNLRYANTASSALTFNVNSKGAKPLYINGEPSSASNKTLPAGSYIAFYNGTNWYFRTDDKLPANIDGNSDTVDGFNFGVDDDQNIQVGWDGDAPEIVIPTSTALPVNQGGTGATTAAEARTNLGLGSAATYNVTSTVNDDNNLVTGGAAKRYIDSLASYSGVVYRGAFTGDIDSITIADGEWSLYEESTYTHQSIDNQGLGVPIFSTFVQYTGYMDREKGYIRTQIIYTNSMIYIRKYNDTGSGSWYDWNVFTSMDATTQASGLMSGSDKEKLNYTNVFYGKCTTAAGTAAKVVTLDNGEHFRLVTGAIIGVKFTYSNTASNVTLNVNSKGAKSIYYNNSVYTGSSNRICGYANRTYYYMFDNANWVFMSNGVPTSDTLTELTGTLAVGHGGTGATTFTSGAALIGNGTGAITTRAIRNNTTNGTIGWTSSSESTQLLTQNDIAYWNGRYNSSSSNLKYCNKGEFKDAATYEVETTIADDAKLPTGAAVKTYVDSRTVLTKTVSGTTSSSGALSHGLDVTTHHVIGARSTDTTNRFAFIRGDGYLTVFQVSGSNMSVLANTSVSFEVYYCAI